MTRMRKKKKEKKKKKRRRRKRKKKEEKRRRSSSDKLSQLVISKFRLGLMTHIHSFDLCLSVYFCLVYKVR